MQYLTGLPPSAIFLLCPSRNRRTHSSQPGHLVVNIPAGTYKLNSTLYISSGTTIHASKEAYLVKQRVYGAVLEGKLVNDRGGYGGCHDITVDGGVWDSKPVMDGKEGTETFPCAPCAKEGIARTDSSNSMVLNITILIHLFNLD